MAKERPILFKCEMVQAILDGRKTQTRRIVKREHQELLDMMAEDIEGSEPNSENLGLKYQSYIDDNGKELGPEWCIHCVECPEEGVIAIGKGHGKPGDRLWVREAHAIVPRTAYTQSIGVQQTLRPDDDHDAAIYKQGWERSRGGIRWRPSIHMPRWASRITLEISAVRIERLQDLSDQDAEAEGVNGQKQAAEAGLDWYDKPRRAFQFLWQSIHGPESWETNPWVWVVEFKHITADGSADE
jgi:hypothetical protein